MGEKTSIQSDEINRSIYLFERHCVVIHLNANIKYVRISLN